MKRVALGWALVWALGCAGGSVAPPAEPSPEVAPELVAALERRADSFYLRLAHRRFNTLETYSDTIMRDYFQSLDLFFDYYAALAQDLLEENFEKSRPTAVEVVDYSFDTRTIARVRVRFRGRDGRPLRPGGTELLRTDRWEWDAGTWWVRPERF